MISPGKKSPETNELQLFQKMICRGTHKGGRNLCDYLEIQAIYAMRRAAALQQMGTWLYIVRELMKMKYNFSKISRSFAMEGTMTSCESYGSGHINETYLLKTQEKETHDYILQRINNHVFRDVPGLMENIRKVISHLHKKMQESGKGDPEKEILTLIPTMDGKSYLFDEESGYWRMYIFVWPNRSCDIVPDGDTAYEGGRMFGRFQNLLSDLPGNELVETIPDFHHIGSRLQSFDSILKDDKYNRAVHAGKELSFVNKYRDSMFRILDLGAGGKIPQRVTHNDTKFNNVLLDEQNKGLCVIDLDTVMPGYVHYDFGDTIRTATNTAAEDEQDLSKVNMDIDIFRGFAKGFLIETVSILNKYEVENLVFSGRLITFTIGLRFLSDYLNGDKYFRTQKEGHNLDRCRAQFKLFESQMEQEESMHKVIREILSNPG